MPGRAIAISVMLIMAAAGSGTADTYYVNGACGDDTWSGAAAVCAGGDGPKATIQAGVDAAGGGDVVIVADGTYSGEGNRDIDLGGKAITLRSQNGPLDCVISCGGSVLEPHRGFHFHSGEGDGSVVRGFTITGGRGDSGGGILCEAGSSPRLEKIILKGNTARDGGAIYCDGSSPTITNVLICDNSATNIGGGLFCNAAAPTISNSTIANNTTPLGSGAIHSNSQLAVITNAIIWGNTDSQVTGMVIITYSDVGGGWAGEGNINADPQFVNSFGGDYGLSGGSPCVDAGDPSFALSPGNEFDLIENPRILGAAVDMGAYEYAAAGRLVRYVDDDAADDPAAGDPTISDPVENGSYAHPFDSIQEAICVARDGDIIVVLDGTYSGDGNRDIAFGGKAITVRSTSGPGGCIIDCQGSDPDRHRGFIFEDAEQSNSVVHGFTIKNGYAGTGGAILCTNGASPTISQMIVTASVGEYGGGAIACYGGSPTIKNVLLYGNSAYYYGGGGLYLSSASAVITNTTIVGNVAPGPGGAIQCDNTGASVASSIIWDNGDNPVVGAVTINHSDVASGWPGTDNIDQDPLFMDPSSSNYRLPPGSPCIDTGDPDFSPGLDDQTDLDGNQRLVGGRVDMGPYEYAALPGATIYVDDDAWLDPAAGDPSGSDPHEDGSYLHPFDAIQEAVDAAVAGDSIVILDGTYTGLGNGDVDLKGKSITVRSSDGPANCIVDCQDAGRGFLFQTAEDADCVLEGLTITNGSASGDWPDNCGAAIFCSGASPTIRNNIVTGNTAVYGGGMACLNGSSALLEGNDVSGNTATYGGGIHCDASSVTIKGNEITGNTAATDGGGIACYAGSAGTIENNIITGNTATGDGGGVYCEGSSPTIISNIINGNNAYNGGGICCYDSASPAVINNVIAGNDASQFGGGVYCHEGAAATFTNDTVADNTATWGGGMGCSMTVPTVTNSIFWGNSPDEISGPATITYSDVGGGWPGEGNINADPQFVNSADDDYRLPEDSPCVDAGDPSFVLSPDSKFDLDGKPRILGSAVDMGAYECDVPGRLVWYVDDDGADDPAAGDPTISDPVENGSYAHPFDSIQEAISVARDGDIVVVLDGAYGGEGNRDIDFGGKAITVLSANGPANCVVDCQGSEAEPRRGFHFRSGEGAGSVVRGFTVRNGYAGTGGAIWCTDGSSPTICRMILTGNVAEYGGGAVASYDSSPKIINSLIYGNTTEWYGGGIYCSNAAAAVTNTTLVDNTADLGGGAIHCDGAAAAVTSSILWANGPDQVGGSAAVTYSDVQGGCEGTGNIDDDPLFVDPGSGNYRLAAGSPGIDTGDPGFDPPPLNQADMDGNPRILDERVDMGSYEYVSMAGRIIYVDDDAWLDPAGGDPSASDPHEEGNYDHPFDAIQEAIDAAQDGDLVMVLNGTYTGPGNRDIDFNGKAITVRSSSGRSSCTIDCQDEGRGFIFQSGEGAGSVLEGFTITNGQAGGDWPDDCGGGVVCLNGSSPTIKDNTITGSAAGDGAGIYCHASAPSISGNMITNNTATSNGGGIACYNGSSPVIDGNTITGNTCVGEGGGVYCDDSSPTIRSSTIAGNSAYSGAGLCGDNNSAPEMINSRITGNTAEYRGGGVYSQNGSSPVITNSTLADNRADWGGGMYCFLGSATVTNAIFWANNPQGQISGPATVTYSDVQGGWAGEGNIDEDPLFTNAAGGNYRLAGGSPGVDTGTNDVVGSLPQKDLAGNERIMDGDGDGSVIVDMGAYERSYFLYVDDDAVDDPGAGSPYVSDPDEDGSASHPFDAIQEAIDVAVDDYNVVIVLDGTYTGSGNRDLDFGGKAIAVQSQNGPENCVIDCEQLGRGFYFENSEDATSVLEGFTITNGSAEDGGGILCSSGSPTISNCWITDNSADDDGGGIYCSSVSPAITDCRITGNSADDDGGGIYCSSASPAITDCHITGNSAGRLGGGVRGSAGPITNCTIADNTAGHGGGLHTCSGTISNCRIVDNHADNDGGGLRDCYGSITNCIVAGNSAVGWGGGFYHCDGVIVNCTIVGNSAASGGGLRDCYVPGEPEATVIANCIIWNNSGLQGPQLYNSAAPSYCSIDGWSGETGQGNMSTDPLFADPDNGDYHLQSFIGRWDPSANDGAGDWVTDAAHSLCIDAGDPSSDYSDEPSPNGGRINMGACGNTIYASKSAPTSRISGHIQDDSGQAIAGVVVSADSGSSTASDSSGDYDLAVLSGWSGVVTPALAGCTFSPVSRSYSNVTSDQAGGDYTGTWATVTISGYVLTAGGLGISGVAMTGLPVEPTTDGSGYYAATVNYGWSGTVRPSKDGCTFSPPSQDYTEVTSDQSNQDYVGTVHGLSISGRVQTDGGLGIADVAMNGLPGTPLTDGSGYYSGVADEGWSGTVTPTKTGYMLSPASRTYTSIASDLIDQDYTAVADCNDNGADDADDIANSTSQDCDGNGVPDECQADSDDDGAIDACENCPADADKTEPGICGCGVSDVDSDGDGVADCNDACPGFDDALDGDGDGVPDGCDVCQGGDDNADADADGVPDGCDICPGFDDAVDTDGDGVPNGCDICDGPDQVDTDSDGVPDACDICPGFDDTLDSDGDTVPDGCDVCSGADDLLDSDGDGVPDGCDECLGFDDSLDADGDGVPDGCDVCAGSDDNADADADGVPDGCDICPGFDDAVDTDGDGVPDGCDVCPSGDDTIDIDTDTVPDACDACPGFDDSLDADADGVPDGCDICPGGDDNADGDLDGVPDACDVCAGFDDALDSDGDGVPNGCDICDGPDQVDADGDGVPDACDICPGFDDATDTDGDGVPDGCDVCPGADDLTDSDGDGVADGCDICPGGDDAVDGDGDGVPDGCDNCPDQANPDQADADGDGIGDACQTTDGPLPTSTPDARRSDPEPAELFIAPIGPTGCGAGVAATQLAPFWLLCWAGLVGMTAGGRRGRNSYCHHRKLD